MPNFSIRFLYLKLYYIFYWRIKKLKGVNLRYFFLNLFFKTPLLEHKECKIKFFTPNSLTYRRSQNLLTTSPQIIEWLNSFEKNSVFFDIGSNIGIYSLYACFLKKNISIYSFEPSTNNLRVLTKNIFINDYQDSIKIIPLPLSNKKFQFNKMQDNIFEEGGALNSYGVDFNFEGKKILSSGGSAYYVPSFSLDFLISLGILELPNYIKIDVDGNEHLILEGSTFLNNNQKTREILVEINDNFLDQKDKVFHYMKSYNFNLKKKFSNDSLSKTFGKTFDYLFKKNEV